MFADVNALTNTGLSPRVRGNLQILSPALGPVGSIPACAGEPCSPPPKQSSRPAGLSPRVRGNRSRSRKNQGLSGSIPACAGEPSENATPLTPVWVYPRVCGGTNRSSHTEQVYPRCGGTVIRNPGQARAGLSPRVRGNLAVQPSIPAAGEPSKPIAIAISCGSIPACAGEPGSHFKVHDEGLSPRVRGNLCVRVQDKEGSGVYPRVCGGGTEMSIPACAERERLASDLSWTGLSPRVRGNPLNAIASSLVSGSIPACAGEPD